MTAPSSHVCYTDEDKSKCIIVHETLSQSCSMDDGKSKRIIKKKMYRRNVLRTRKNYILRRKTKHNALLRNKNMQRVRLHMTCRTILTSLAYSNAEERF